MCCIQVGAMSQPSVSGFTAGPANASMYKVRVPRWGTYNVVHLKFGQNSLWGGGRDVYPKEGVLHGGVLGTLWSDDDDISDSITEKLTLHPFRLFCDYSNSFSLFEGRKLSGSWREQTPTDLRKIQ